MKIEHFFFDLDRTLWNFEKNSHEALEELYESRNLSQLGIKNCSDFVTKYKEINEEFWALYRDHKITKKVLRKGRFRKAFESFGIQDEQLADEFGEFYIRLCPTKTNLVEGAIETLDYLRSKYKLHIITNGFEETQSAKLTETGLNRYFEHVITSEMVQRRKPNPIIFEFALEKAGALPQNSAMVGDDLATDIKGAETVGMTSIFFNPRKTPHNSSPSLEIQCLTRLCELF